MTLLKPSWGYLRGALLSQARRGLWDIPVLPEVTSRWLQGLSPGWVLFLFPIGCFSSLAVAGASRC